MRILICSAVTCHDTYHLLLRAVCSATALALWEHWCDCHRRGFQFYLFHFFLPVFLRFFFIGHLTNRQTNRKKKTSEKKNQGRRADADSRGNNERSLAAGFAPKQPTGVSWLRPAHKKRAKLPMLTPFGEHSGAFFKFLRDDDDDDQRTAGGAVRVCTLLQELGVVSERIETHTCTHDLFFLPWEPSYFMRRNLLSTMHLRSAFKGRALWIPAGSARSARRGVPGLKGLCHLEIIQTGCSSNDVFYICCTA